MREREAIADVGHEGPLVLLWLDLKGIAVQCDVVQDPAGIKRNEQMPFQLPPAVSLTGEVFSPAGRSGAVPRSSGSRIP